MDACWLAFLVQNAGIISAVLLTVFTGGLWVTSIWQWCAINKQIKLQTIQWVAYKNWRCSAARGTPAESRSFSTSLTKPVTRLRFPVPGLFFTSAHKKNVSRSRRIGSSPLTIFKPLPSGFPSQLRRFSNSRETNTSRYKCKETSALSECLNNGSQWLLKAFFGAVKRPLGLKRKH